MTYLNLPLKCQGTRPRDRKEIERLEVQHQCLLTLANGLLIHPLVSRKTLQRIADVGTGTGVWLRELTKAQGELRPDPEFVGFDISKEQFPPIKAASQEFVVHDITIAFPDEYLEFFDLVNVRLLSYALKAHDLKQAVGNVVRIIRESRAVEPSSINTLTNRSTRSRWLPSVARD